MRPIGAHVDAAPIALLHVERPHATKMRTSQARPNSQARWRQCSAVELPFGGALC